MQSQTSDFGPPHTDSQAELQVQDFSLTRSEVLGLMCAVTVAALDIAIAWGMISLFPTLKSIGSETWTRKSITPKSA